MDVFTNMMTRTLELAIGGSDHATISIVIELEEHAPYDTGGLEWMAWDDAVSLLVQLEAIVGKPNVRKVMEQVVVLQKENDSLSDQLSVATKGF